MNWYRRIKKTYEIAAAKAKHEGAKSDREIEDNWGRNGRTARN